MINAINVKELSVLDVLSCLILLKGVILGRFITVRNQVPSQSIKTAYYNRILQKRASVSCIISELPLV